MNYEVELLKAWMDQGQRTENDGTPIPPVMPEPTPTGEPRDKVRAMLAERRGIERDEALGRVHDARLRIDELEAREVPDPPAEEPNESWEAWARREAPGDDSGECNETTLRARFEMALRKESGARSVVEGVTLYLEHEGECRNEEEQDQDDNGYCVGHCEYCCLARIVDEHAPDVLSRTTALPPALPEGARWDGDALNYGKGLTCKACVGWPSEGTWHAYENGGRSITKDEALATLAVLSRAKDA